MVKHTQTIRRQDFIESFVKICFLKGSLIFDQLRSGSVQLTDASHA